VSGIAKKSYLSFLPPTGYLFFSADLGQLYTFPGLPQKSGGFDEVLGDPFPEFRETPKSAKKGGVADPPFFPLLGGPGPPFPGIPGKGGSRGTPPEKLRKTRPR